MYIKEMLTLAEGDVLHFDKIECKECVVVKVTEEGVYYQDAMHGGNTGYIPMWWLKENLDNVIKVR